MDGQISFVEEKNDRNKPIEVYFDNILGWCCPKCLGIGNATLAKSAKYCPGCGQRLNFVSNEKRGRVKKDYKDMTVKEANETYGIYGVDIHEKPKETGYKIGTYGVNFIKKDFSGFDRMIHYSKEETLKELEKLFLDLDYKELCKSQSNNMRKQKSIGLLN